MTRESFTNERPENRTPTTLEVASQSLGDKAKKNTGAIMVLGNFCSYAASLQLYLNNIQI